MSALAIRSAAAELAIGLALCAAGYFLLVEPAERRLAEVSHRVERLERTARAGDGPAVSDEQAQRATARVRARAQNVAARSAPAGSETAMFSALMALADAHNARIDQLQPMPVRERTGTLATRGGARSAYSMSVLADFGDLASLVEALQHDLGFTNIRSIRLTSTGEPGTRHVQAAIETEHRGFDPGPALTGADPAAGGTP